MRQCCGRVDRIAHRGGVIVNLGPQLGGRDEERSGGSEAYGTREPYAVRAIQKTDHRITPEPSGLAKNWVVRSTHRWGKRATLSVEQRTQSVAGTSLWTVRGSVADPCYTPYPDRRARAPHVIRISPCRSLSYRPGGNALQAASCRNAWGVAGVV